jgi:diaminopimelate decarboxylase
MDSFPLLPLSSSISLQGCLTIAGQDLELLANMYGTPLYLYDAATIHSQVETLHNLLEKYYPGESLAAYAAKAYFSEGMSRKLAALGMGVDVVSLGEIELALRGGFSPGVLHLQGNNKSEAELSAALEIHAQAIVVDNLDELHLLENMAARRGSNKARIWLRVTPTVQGHTHAHIDTSGANSKFGLHIENGQAAAALRYARASAWLDLAGLHTHLGSQLFEPETYREAIHQLYQLAQNEDFCPQEFSPGGGWGVRYTAGDPEDTYALWVEAVCGAVVEESSRLGWLLPRLVLEPGRSLVARAGVALYRVGSQKTTPSGLCIVAVDGGLADNPRHALYQARYTALAVRQPNSADAAASPARLVGKFCESGDVLIPEVLLPPVERGDLIAVPVAGAYQLSMASNYNLAPRPAVLWLDENKAELLQRREVPQDSGWWMLPQ